MRGAHNIKRATTRAQARERKRTPKMKISGKSVFTIAKQKDKTKG